MDTTKTTEDVNRGNQPSSDEIKSDIDRTRERMDQTISELGERLHPRNLISDLMDYLRSSSSASSDGRTLAQDAQKAGKAILNQVRLHPIPSILVTAGIVALLMEQKRRNTVYVTVEEEYEEDSPRVWVTDYTEPVETYEPVSEPNPQFNEGSAPPQETQSKSGIMDTIKNTGSKAGEKIHAATESVKTAVGTVKDKISSAAHSTAQGSRHFKDRTSAVAGRVRSQVQHGYEVSRQRYQHGAENYPLAMGAGCLALGVLVGFLLPHTRREDELLGQTAARVKDRTKEAGSRLVDRTKEVAKEVADAALGEARSQGLTPGNLAEKVSHVASTTGQTIKEKAKQEGEELKQTAQQGSMEAKSGLQSSPGSSNPVIAGPGCGCGPSDNRI